MKTYVTESCGIRYVKLQGLVQGTEAPQTADFVDELLAEGNRNIIWNFEALDPSADFEGVAVLAEIFARVQAEDSFVIVLRPPERILGFLRQVGVGRKIAVAATEQEAMVHLFNNIEKQYDDAFFQLLIREGLATQQQLEEAFQEYEARGKVVPIDTIMLEMGFLTVEDIMHAWAIRKTFIGEILVDAGIITSQTLRKILEMQKMKGGKLGDLLKEYGAVNDQDIYEALAIQYRRKTELAAEDDREVTVDDLIFFLSGDDYVIIKATEDRLVDMGGKVVPSLLEHIKREDLPFRPTLARMLGEIGDGRAALVLGDYLDSEDYALRDEAYWALVKITKQERKVTATWRWRRWLKSNASSLPEVPPRSKTDDLSFDTIIAELLENKRDLSKFTLEYEAGKLNWEGGKVNLLLFGDGKVLLKRNTRNDISLLSSSLSKARVLELLQTLWDARAWRIKSAREHCSVNEPRHVLTFKYGYEHRLSVYYWATEMYGNLNLMNIENAVKVVLKLLTL